MFSFFLGSPRACWAYWWTRKRRSPRSSWWSWLSWPCGRPRANGASWWPWGQGWPRGWRAAGMSLGHPSTSSRLALFVAADMTVTLLPPLWILGPRWPPWSSRNYWSKRNCWNARTARRERHAWAARACSKWPPGHVPPAWEFLCGICSVVLLSMRKKLENFSCRSE